jgi:large subunit ribosomal protein L32
MAVPKKRQSRTRRDKRRANHKAPVATINECPRCHSPRLPHRVCPTCGTYAGREVIRQEIAGPSAPASTDE